MHDPLAYLCNLNSMKIRLGLGPVSGVLSRLNSPHEKYQTILVGGTNGKGSISSMIAAILCESGFKVGLYTSPHLIDVRERIKVNGEMITSEDMIRYILDVKKELRNDELTYFEFLTAIAFLHFLRAKVDIAVLEVGMGGRLDATNVVKPLVSVISNISYDHQMYLGDSLDAIAREKAGIIKFGSICVIGAKQKEVIDVIEGICLERKTVLYRLGREIKIRVYRNGTFDYRGIVNNYKKLACPLKGRHQSENAALAIAAVELIRGQGFAVEENAIRKGIENVKWEGRLEVLRQEPLIIADGAHNPGGIIALCRSLRREFDYNKLVFIFGVLNDKNYSAMLRRIALLADSLIVTKPKTERAVPLDELSSCAKRYISKVEIAENISEALEMALSKARRDDLICVTGSLYLVGEAKQTLATKRIERVWQEN